jgi:DNA-binding transcriptional MerR regulator
MPQYTKSKKTASPQNEFEPVSPSFGSLDVAKLAGISLRQLQWWDEESVVSPLQSEHRRIYRFDETVLTMLVAGLRSRGISLQRVRWFLPHLRKRVGDWDTTGDLYLITDGRSAVFESEDESVILQASAAPGGVFVLSLGDITGLIREYTIQTERHSVLRRTGVSPQRGLRNHPAVRS